MAQVKTEQVMTDPVGASTLGTFKFTLPDLSLAPFNGGAAAFEAPKETSFITLPLHDYRTSSLVRGAPGLTEHGFTVVNHKSTLSEDSWSNVAEIEDVYFEEIRSMVKALTGAREAIVLNAAFRRQNTAENEATDDAKRDSMRRAAEAQTDPEGKKTKSVIIGAGGTAAAQPVRGVHCDYSPAGARRMLRNCRVDVIEAAREAIQAEDRDTAANGLDGNQKYTGPRYAVYSIWRPLKPVHRDPLAVADWRSVAPEDFVEYEYTQAIADHSYIACSYAVRPSKSTHQQRWYWLPEQTPEEVLVIKFADSDAGNDSENTQTVAGGAPHASPELNFSGVEAESLPPRESIEVRVVAFW